MSRPALTMAETAAAAGFSYDGFRKAWPRLARDEGFPQPFRARCWDPDAVEAWRADRSQPRALPAAPPANDFNARRDSAWAQLERARRAS